MEKTPFHYRGRTLLTLASGLFLSHSCLLASEILFEDQFGSNMPRSEQTEDFDINLNSRQTGALAPSAYSRNGQSWQTQATPFNTTMSFRLYLKADWLGFSPNFELKKEDGRYSLAWEFDTRLHPDNALEEILAIGRAEPRADETTHLDLQGTFAITVQTGADPSIHVWNDGSEIGSALLPSTATHNSSLVLTWIQKHGQISNMEVSFDGAKVEIDSGAALKLAAPRILIGARNRIQMQNATADTLPVIQLHQLTYSKD